MIGNVSPISGNFFKKLDTTYKCIVVGDNMDTWNCKNVISYKERGNGEELSRLYSTYNFETVIYFSNTIEGCKTPYNELEKLDATLKICIEHNIHNFIYITAYNAGDCGNILMQACESLCQSYSKEEDFCVTILKVPYLYSTMYAKNQLSDWIGQAKREKKITFDRSPDSMIDFLCDKDLAELIKRRLDTKQHSSYQVISLSGNNKITVEELVKQISRQIPDTVGIYEEKQMNLVIDEDQKVFEQFTWKPSHTLKRELSTVIDVVKNKKEAAEVETKKKTSKVRSKVKMCVELVLMFVGVLLLNHWTEDNILISFLDFRFLYVVSMGMIYGLNAGVIAAFLSCGDYIIENTQVTHWQVMFYNVQNWLPFASYILIGTVSGYLKDKHENEVSFVKKEQEILEDKYIFLNEQYLTILENKDRFNSQIIGYQDSFGKLYSVVKKLDSTLTNEVFFEAINVIEDMLDNHSVAIYSINGESDYARLNVCSKSIYHELGKSLALSDYPEMVEKLKNNKAFVNTTCLAEYPVYATPIYKGNELLGMILLMNADDSQMNMEFSNKLRILSDLIKDSLIRAMEYENYSDQVIEGTQIVKEEIFNEILSVNEQMREKEYLNYALLRLHHAEMSMEQLANVVAGLVRSSDVLGIGRDRALHLLLSQTGRQDLAIISERLKKYNIQFDVVKA